MIKWSILLQRSHVIEVLLILFVKNVVLCFQLWQRDTLECSQVLHGHTGSVLCLQYDDNVIVSGSSDATVRYVTDFATDIFFNGIDEDVRICTPFEDL